MSENVYVVPALCGTCDHGHGLDGCEHCQAEGRECLGWAEHPMEAAYADEQEIREMTELGAKPLVDVHMANGVLEVLSHVETRRHPIDHAGMPPVVLAFQLYETTRVFNAEQHVIRACELRLPESLFESGSDEPMKIFTQVAADWYHDSLYPTIAWAIVCDGEVGAAENAGRQKAHIAAAIDLDGRAYVVVRDRATGTVESEVKVMPGWARLLRKDLASLGSNPVRKLEEDKLSEPHMAAMHLMIVTRTCMDLCDGSGCETPDEPNPTN